MTSSSNTAPSFLVGVTGGIGSGKSVVCEAFANEGFPVLSADIIAKDLCGTDPALRKKLTKILGPETYAVDGTYNRSYVASRIFADDEVKAAVEAAIHPRVEKEIKHRATELASSGQGIVIVEAALVYEAEMDSWLDAVVVVDADETVRVQRIVTRDGITEADVRDRIKSQLPNAQKLEWADYVIKNNGTPEELHDRVRFFTSLFRSLLQLRTA
jgi:dephospho-CoA kinase